MKKKKRKKIDNKSKIGIKYSNTINKRKMLKFLKKLKLVDERIYDK